MLWGSSIRIQSGANGSFGAIKFRFQQGVHCLAKVKKSDFVGKTSPNVLKRKSRDVLAKLEQKCTEAGYMK